MRLLLIEDDEVLGSGLKKALERDGSVVEWLKEGRFVTDAIQGEPFEVILLDLGLPDVDGIDVLQNIRANGEDVPIVVLTARDTLDERVLGLDAGADDYLVKPFAIEELQARIRAMTRRRHEAHDSCLKLARLEINTASMQVELDGQAVSLNRREYACLLELANHSGRVLSRERLETVLYGWQGELESNALEVHIHHLRKKLYPQLIQTVRGVGYRLRITD